LQLQETMDETENPTTGEELLARWAARDDEYARQRTPMEPEVADAIREGRRREAGMLKEVGARARMWAKADVWQPPIHPEFGSIEDWLRND
jgi:hypothetical protein